MAKKIKDKTIKAAIVREMNMLDYAKDSLMEYATMTIEDRAIPDFRDGLKPVHRRILWAMHKLNLTPEGPFKKSARTVGDVIGKYHPHGDSAVYETMVKMANLNQKLIDGQGNWGTMTDPAAAMRYTESKLSVFAQRNFFDKHLRAIVDTTATFDGSYKEPVILNTQLPTLLINGAQGIAVGTTCYIPSYELLGVAKLTAKALGGKEITVKDCIQDLVFTVPNGGKAWLDDEDAISELNRFYKTGEGTVYFYADYVIDGYKVIFNEFPPGVNPIKLKDEILPEYPFIDRVDDTTDLHHKNFEYTITLKRSVKAKEIEERAEEIAECFVSQAQSYKINITERILKDDQVSAVFRKSTVPQILNEWAKWRLEVEVSSIEAQLQDTGALLDKEELKLLVIANPEIMKKATQTDDSEAFLMKALKIKKEQATYLMDRTYRQGKKLDKSKVESSIKELKSHVQELKDKLKSPSKSVISGIKQLVKDLN